MAGKEKCITLINKGKTCEAIQKGKKSAKGADVKLNNKMKRLFLILIAVIGLGIIANGQSCKIQNGDGATLVIESTNIDSGGAVVTVGNDHESKPAQVTLSAEVTFSSTNCPSSKKTKICTGSGRCGPNQSTPIKLNGAGAFSEGNCKFEPISIGKVNLESARCQ